MGSRTIEINRAPVLTLWAAVVAERMGFDWDEAVSLGRAVAGLNAQAKGRRLGLFKPAEGGAKQARKKKRGEEFWVEVCGRAVPAVSTPDGVRAVKGDQPIASDKAVRYLESKFGEDLAAARAAMRTLASAFAPEDLETRAYGLYERFRPEIPKGRKGWGAKGDLDLEFLASLADEA